MTITELDRALAREDARSLIRHVDARSEYFSNGAREWPDESADDFEKDLCGFYGDNEKALAFIVIAAARSDNVNFLAYLGAGLLEGIVDDPSCALLDRIVAEANRSKRFQWMLDCPYEVAFSPLAWEALKGFRKRSGDLAPYEPLPPTV